MSRKINWKDFLSGVFLVLGALMLLVATNFAKAPADTDSAAAKMQARVVERMEALDGYAGQAISQDYDKWMDLPGLPADMVVYRYLSDSLQSWAGRFTVINDDISSRVMFKVLSNPRSTFSSPLAEVTSEASFVNLGQKWYLLKAYEEGPCTVIAGLEVMDAADASSNGVNPHFRLDSKFSVRPISFSGGSEVCVDGIPQFKVLYDTLLTTATSDARMMWAALLLLAASCLLMLYSHRNVKCLAVTSLMLLMAFAAMYLWGFRARGSVRIFSPVLYADGPFFYSLGAVLITNMAIFSAVLCAYLMRRVMMRRILRSGRSRLLLVLGALAIVLAAVGILAYTHKVFSSIVENSGICLELYKFNELSPYTGVVYLAFVVLLMTLVLLLQMLRPAAREFLGLRYDAFSMGSRLAFSLLIGVYFVAVSAVLGHRKETDTADLWASRLSIDRDIALEMQLRRVEASIASDALVGALSYLPNSNVTILNRIAENYLTRLTQNYDISVYIMNDAEKDPRVLSFFQERMRNASQITDGSRFFYLVSGNGRIRYTGVFTYFDARYGVNHVMLDVEPRSILDDRGYASIMNFTAPGRVVMPAKYSFAKYSEGMLSTFSGSYPYPTLETDRLKGLLASSPDGCHVKSGGYTHFFYDVSDGVRVIISRESYSFVSFIIAAVFIALLSFLMLMLCVLKRRRVKTFGSNYFRSRITSVLLVSLVLTLVVMASVSVLFVFRRNEANMHSMMSERINSIQALVEPACRSARSFRDIDGQEISTFLDNASTMTKADITLYTPAGKAFRSTAPEVFDRMLVSDRVAGDAYDNIVYRHMRYYVGLEELGGKQYYSLYAPLFNKDGVMVAMLGTPYTDESYDFEMDALSHSISIMVVFLILLLLARFMAVTVVDRMFKPLLEMGRKMKASDVEGLEYIDYDREDEISSLVAAYNRMVHDLSESTRQLAQAERDKAWSSMARQVAHEIKNPLTPMKLQLQRLIRLKERNAPNWQDKFDEVAAVILDHIDVLTDTANEFSTFAKLYTEEPTSIDLDLLIQEEIAMFDSKENIEFEYIGLSGVPVMGPKPQLTRVLVNLITNSVQAIEIAQQEAEESGLQVSAGKVRVSLRNSTRDGYYDIVFEDNGPGVPEENRQKLFTPNFTTKSSGTGLGLAICRSILEKCGADISYSRSFSLGGACFLIKYPKS